MSVTIGMLLLSLLSVMGQAIGPATRPAASQPANPYASLSKFREGVPVRVGAWTYTVTSAKWMDQAADRSITPEQQKRLNHAYAAQDVGMVSNTVSPRKGMLFLGVNVTATNQGTEPAAPQQIGLVDGAGHSYMPDPIAFRTGFRPAEANPGADSYVGAIWELRQGPAYFAVLKDERGAALALIALRPVPLPPKPKANNAKRPRRP